MHRNFTNICIGVVPDSNVNLMPSVCMCMYVGDVGKLLIKSSPYSMRDIELILYFLFLPTQTHTLTLASILISIYYVYMYVYVSWADIILSTKCNWAGVQKIKLLILFLYITTYM